MRFLGRYRLVEVRVKFPLEFLGWGVVASVKDLSERKGNTWVEDFGLKSEGQI